MNISPSFRFARGPAGVVDRILMISLAAVIWADDSGMVEGGWGDTDVTQADAGG